MSPISTVDEMVSSQAISAPGRGRPSSSRLEEHLQSTVKRLRKLGIRRGACVASVLPDGPDALTVEMIVQRADANLAPLAARASRETYETWLFETNPKLLLLHSGAHPAREAARSLGIPIANVLRHFEAGIFTLEADTAPLRPDQGSAEPPVPAWKKGARGIPVVLIAPGPAYRRLANRLDAVNPVVGITPPSLEHLPLPHTIEHIAAECVRILRRYRPQGPYALAGWRVDSLVALEMARLLEEEGEKVVFVAMLDASALFHSPGISLLRRFFFATRKLLRPKCQPPADFMAQALRQYRPRPWFGKILHLRPAGSTPVNPSLHWHDIAPQGIASYDAPSEMLAEPNVHRVATILAAELVKPKTISHAP